MGTVRAPSNQRLVCPYRGDRSAEVSLRAAVHVVDADDVVTRVEQVNDSRGGSHSRCECNRWNTQSHAHTSKSQQQRSCRERHQPRPMQHKAYHASPTPLRQHTVTCSRKHECAQGHAGQVSQGVLMGNDGTPQRRSGQRSTGRTTFSYAARVGLPVRQYSYPLW